MSEDQYKKLIKNKVKNATFNQLKALQNTHSKVREIKYEALGIQQYMLSSEFSNKEVSLLINLRSYSVRGIRMNFSSWCKSNLGCPLGCRMEDSREIQDDQEHLLQCKPILEKLTLEELYNINNLSYKDISKDVKHQKQSVKLFSKALEIRKQLLEIEIPASGPSQDAASNPGSNRGPVR